MIELTASSLTEILAHVRDVRSTWNPDRNSEEEVWFRGQSRRRYELLPGLYRPEVAKYNYDEISIFEAFKALGTPFATPRPASEWEWYFLAQHYRLPTRLLDWTENALAAVYFAVSAQFLTRDRLALGQMLAAPRQPSVFDAESPAIWILDAISLNKWSCQFAGIVAPPGTYSDPYLPESIRDPASERLTQDPIAVLPPHSNPRIHAQQGTFVLFGRSDIPLDAISAGDRAQQPPRLAVITLDRANLAELWDDLEVAGVGQLALFPELDSVAEHVKRLYQRPIRV